MLFFVILSFYVNILICAPFSKSVRNCWLEDKLLLLLGSILFSDFTCPKYPLVLVL